MIDLEKFIDFSCPDNCGQIAVGCSLRMILDDGTFFCESCGCEFRGSDYPRWLAAASCSADQKRAPEYGAMVALYAYRHAGGGPPAKNIISALLKADRSLWKLFPPDKLPADLQATLIDDAEFRSRLDYSRLTGEQIVSLLAARPGLLAEKPELEGILRWEMLTSLQWAKLLIAAPDSLPLRKHCVWRKIIDADWEKIIRDGKNDYALAVYRVRRGTEVAASIKKYPELKKYIPWTRIPMPEYLNLLAEFPQFVKKCPWQKLYEYIVSLPAEQQQSIKDRYPQLWEKRSEVLTYVDFSENSELQKLPADQYYTVVDFFDWEEFFDYAALSPDERLDLFVKHPQFGECFGLDNLSAGEKARLARLRADFERRGGGNRRKTVSAKAGDKQGTP